MANQEKKDDLKNGAHEEKIYLELPVIYTPEKMAKLGLRISTSLREKRNLEAAKKSSAKSYQMQIEDIDEIIINLGDKIEKGAELTTVECISFVNKFGKVEKVIRKDTGEIVEGEQQVKMNLEKSEAQEETQKEEQHND